MIFYADYSRIVLTGVADTGTRILPSRSAPVA